ncbi:helix-turn-helix transcriptional regulator [Kutzneria sp. 744]|uniref:helix-turn-helix transcriptional regulator n=1 Tax=Kutzneria sp. (strain 744) TaxID=345341 RepID=UPI0003EEC420|nr:helix-turn-helix transcriptional regulator [Kutzneria sp. 744]EWM12311.1 transcriptional regulator, AraC family [Kutzneria sp. 744]
MSALIEGRWIDSAALPLPYPAVDLLVFADGTLWLAGPEVSVRTAPLPPGGLVGLRLRPGACLSLGVAADEVPLGGMPFGRVEPGSPRSRMASAVKFLDGFSLHDNDFAVQQAVRALQDDPTARVNDLAATVGLSERQLRRRFSLAVGLRPKAYGRVVRLHAALRLARSVERPSWADIAQRCGFYDQPHLIAEFRAATGQSPKALHGRFLQSSPA